VLRRPGWSFAAGIPIFIFARLSVREWLRPSLISPRSVASLSGFSSGALNGGWILHLGILPIGRLSPAPGQTWTTDPSLALSDCMASAKATSTSAINVVESHCALVDRVHYVIDYQPASHYWALQGVEALIFVAMASVLCVASVLVVRGWRA
jgi:hypothetical protein